MNRARSILLVVLAWSLLALGPLALPAARAQEPLRHVVAPNQTLFSIARSYGLTVASLMKANQLKSKTIYVGQRLIIPGYARTGSHHIVARGETLLAIAAKYGVSWWDIAFRNHLPNMHRVYVGQRLAIPERAATPTPAPTATVAATATPMPPPTAAPMLPAGEAIVITLPAPDTDVTSPLEVAGYGSAFENTLAVDILDEGGVAIGQGIAVVEGEMGRYGPFTGVISFTAPSRAQWGRVQIYSIAPRDGAIERLSSVSIKLQP